MGATSARDMLVSGAHAVVRVTHVWQAEEAALAAGRARTASKAGGARCVWNHAEFRVDYPSLAKELCVGDVYIKLLLEGLDQVCCPILQPSAAT